MNIKVGENSMQRRAHVRSSAHEMMLMIALVENLRYVISLGT
jgi:hypothetical protein